MLDLLQGSRESGLDVTFDTYPYNLSSTRLLYPGAPNGRTTAGPSG